MFIYLYIYVIRFSLFRRFNVVMIVGMYAEYLWAADFGEMPTHCDMRTSLPLLDFANCFHRYTFSHAMLRRRIAPRRAVPPRVPPRMLR